MSTLEHPVRDRIEITDPRDGSVVGSVPMAGRDELDHAVDAARRSKRQWARTPAEQRGVALRTAAAALRERAAELAAANESETGRPAGECREGVLAGAGTLEQYAELGPLHRGRSLLGDVEATDLMVPEPRGVVVALTPWNDPVAVACGLIGGAAVTGNTVVHKPSERVPHTGALLGEVLADTLPADVVRTVQGDGTVGAELVNRADIDLVAHVGSVATGHSIATSAASTGAKTLLENGGNDPLLIDADVDPDWAAEQAATGAFANSGQICVSVERIYCHRDIADRFLAALRERAESAELAPLVDRAHRELVHEHVAEALGQGARCLAGGAIPDGPGAHYPATVLSGCDSGMRALSEETFGPVAAVRVVDSFEQGLAEACEGPYGLAATVLTGSMANSQLAWRQLPVGSVKVNAVFGGAPGGAAEPRGASGTGFGYGPELLDEMTRTKTVHIEPPG